jgi:hypothetical protein
LGFDTKKDYFAKFFIEISERGGGIKHGLPLFKLVVCQWASRRKIRMGICVDFFTIFGLKKSH